MINQKFKFFIIAGNACLGVFNLGYGITNLTMAFNTLFLVLEIPLEEQVYEMALLSAIIELGILIGSFLSKFLLKLVSRKRAMIIADLIGLLSLITLIPERQTITIFRLIWGISNGINQYVVPLYIREISPQKLYSSLSLLTETMISLGIVAGQLFGLGFLYYNDKESVYWQYTFAIPGIVSFIRMVCLLTILPFDSPYDQINCNDEKKMLNLLAKLYKKDEVGTIFKEIQYEHHLRCDSSAKFCDIFRQNYYRRTIMACMVAFFYVWSGINCLFYYSGQIFNDLTGGDDLMNWVLTLIIGITKLLSSVLGFGIINKIGTKPLLGYSGLLLFMTLLAISLLYNFQPSSYHIVVAALIFVSISIYGSTLAQVTWSLIEELVNQDGAWLAIVILSCNITALIYLFPLMVQFIGSVGTFGIYAGLNFLSFIYFRFILIETRGLTPVQIEEVLQHDWHHIELQQQEQQ